MSANKSAQRKSSVTGKGTLHSEYELLLIWDQHNNSLINLFCIDEINDAYKYWEDKNAECS